MPRRHGSPPARAGHALPSDRKGGLIEAGIDYAGWRRLDEQLRHSFHPGDTVGVGLIDPFVGVIEVDRIGNQPDLAVVMIKDSEIGRQQEGKLGNLQVVDAGIRQPLHPPYRVVVHADLSLATNNEGD